MRLNNVKYCKVWQDAGSNTHELIYYSILHVYSIIYANR